MAKVDVSLGQTERLMIAYDRAYLHFFLAFRARAVTLGPCHVSYMSASYRYISLLVYNLSLYSRNSSSC